MREGWRRCEGVLEEKCGRVEEDVREGWRRFDGVLQEMLWRDGGYVREE